MKYLLLIFIITGDNHGMQTQEFTSKESCEIAAEMITNKTAIYTPKKRPLVACVFGGY